MKDWSVDGFLLNIIMQFKIACVIHLIWNTMHNAIYCLVIWKIECQELWALADTRYEADTDLLTVTDPILRKL